MNVLIIGAGRMGQRHAKGVVSIEEVEKVCVIDIFEAALDTAKQNLAKLSDSGKLSYCLKSKFKETDTYQIAIMATTGAGRIALYQWLESIGIESILIEKPLGQSYQEVQDLITQSATSVTTKTYVNLNMRMYKGFQQLKKDLNTFPQFQGPKVITLNTGSLGIGANGIHYLDLLYYLLDADRAELVAGEIEDTLIPSGRGKQFADFGGWCSIKFFDKEDKYLGRAHLSMSSQSTVFGGWDIVGTHGRIMLNEIQQSRVDILRKPESTMPVYRYAADYQSPIEHKVVSPYLDTLTKKWLEGLLKNEEQLPTLSESLAVHKLLFDWLSLSKSHQYTFPIT